MKKFFKTYIRLVSAVAWLGVLLHQTILRGMELQKAANSPVSAILSFSIITLMSVLAISDFIFDRRKKFTDFQEIENSLYDVVRYGEDVFSLRRIVIDSSGRTCRKGKHNTLLLFDSSIVPHHSLKSVFQEGEFLYEFFCVAGPGGKRVRRISLSRKVETE